MPTARVETKAIHRPGKCLITRDTRGPFIDTGINITGYGRVYLSIPKNAWLFAKAGFLSEEGYEDLEQERDELVSENQTLQKKAGTLDELVNSVLPYLPDVKPEVREVEVVKARTPTDEEIEEWIRTRGGNHPAVRSAQRLEPGSTEEWYALYGSSGPKAPKRARTTVTETGKEIPTTLLPDAEGGEEVGPPRIVKLHDQDVDLDEVLKGSIDEVVKYSEGHGEEFELALLDREVHNAGSQGKEPRKGLIEKLGYDYTDFVDAEEEDEEVVEEVSDEVEEEQE